MKIINVVGARPNFMKMAPIIAAMNRYPDEIEHLLVHTGQHYDEQMSKAFFDDLGMPKPDIDLGVGSGSHAFGLAHYLEPREDGKGILVTDPLGYLEFLHLTMNARMVLTDSGGLQEETTVLGVPCITLRHNTERPITVEQGTNVVIGNDKHRILAAADDVLEGRVVGGRVPEKWDGKSAHRIVEWLTAN